MKRKACFFLILVLCLMPALLLKSYALDAAPDFSLNDLNNGSVSLSQFKGKGPVILFFWTTWCPFCRDQLDLLKDKYSRLKQDGIEVMVIDVGERKAKVESFVKGRNFPFSVLLDQSTGVAKNYKVYGVPTYIFIDKSGNIILKENNFPDYKTVFGIQSSSKDGQ